MSEDEYVEGLNNLVETAVSGLESSSFAYEQPDDGGIRRLCRPRDRH